MGCEKITSVRYGFTATELLAGLDAYNRYDAEACAQKYASLCQDLLEQEYPGAEVEVLFDTDADGVLASSMETRVLKQVYREAEPDAQFEDESDFYEVSDPHEVEIVEHLCSKVYQEYKWVVRRPWLSIQKAYRRHGIPASFILWACKQGLIEEAEKTAGHWEFPLDALGEIEKNSVFANCREILGIGIAEDGAYTFECFPKDTLHICSTDFPLRIRIFLVVASILGIPLFDNDNSSVLMSKRASRINLVFEHFRGEIPWISVPWSYDTYAKALVAQAGRYECIESEWQESKHSGKTFVESMQFKFACPSSPQYTLRKLIDQAVGILGDIIQNTKIHLSGGPVWQDRYEEEEIPFCEEVLKPLLENMGFKDVRYTHGQREHGRDFTFCEPTKFGEIRYYGLQAKAGNVSGGVKSQINEIFKQIEMGFEMPYYEVGDGSPKYVSDFIVAISGHFTKQAKDEIRAKMRRFRVNIGSVYFWDKEKIRSLIAQCWAND